MKKIYTLLFLVYFHFSNVYAQCSLYPVALSDRLINSSLVIEGEILSQKSFWNSAGNYIYTSNLISVNRVLKGKYELTQLEVITEGGEIDQKKQTVEPSLQLKPGDEGLFTLNSFELLPSQFGFNTFKAYADIQGFVLYDPRDESASEPFVKYTNISKDLYPKLNSILGITLSAYVNTSGKGYSSGTTAAVTGFSPTTITAGTSSIITITGTGFGTVQGTSYVEFFNADDGGSTYIQPHSSQYVSWSNTQIQVMVPTRASTVAGTAGTGPIRVTVAGSPTVSTQTLTVSYGELNVYYSTNSTIYNTRHVDLNGSSGITWQMYTSFDANTSAKTSFLSSLQTWRCNTYINWSSGTTTTVNTIASDGTNVVRFDVGSELPIGVLGRCTSYFSGCITGTVVNWFVDELDICFDEPSTSAITWQFGPSLATGSQYDFESVSLHELGHGHQLSHVINSSDVMHYALSNAQNKRTLITDNINGGNDVMLRNVSTGVCSMNAMVALSATACSLSSPTASFNAASTVCVGQLVTFTDVTTGSPTSWSWTLAGGSTSSSTLQNPSTTYSTAGVYSISLSATNAFGTSTVLTKTISVLVNPSLTVANASICSGTSTLLTVSGASSYTWNPGALTGATQTINPNASTNYTIIGSNGSCTSTANSSITVINTPTLNIPNASICSGTSTLITAAGASAYTWSPGNLTGASQNLNPSATIVYTVTGSNSGCNAVSQFTIDVTITPTVSTNMASICSGNSAVLTASGATSYTWMPGNLSGASQNLNPGTTTIYTITGANASCTHSTTTTLSVTSTPTLSVADASICSGTSTLLTATGANTYQWMPGNLSGGSQNLNPLSTSIYTITGSIGSCTSAITTTVNVTTTPTISAANASICPGASAVINASGAASYTWTPGNLNGSSQTLSPTSTTNYTIVGTNGNCSDSKTISVHVYTVFQAFGIATPATICYGQSSNLVAGGGTTYTWTAAGYTANGSMPPPVNPTVTTIYNLAGFDGTCVTTNTVLIVVNPLPTLTVPGATICNGTTATITASGATNYTWTPGNLYGGSQTFTPSSTTTYTVKGEYTTGCSSTNNFTITVNPLPVVSINSSTSSLCSGQSATLTATSGLTYNWSHGLGTINPVAVSPGSNTQYTVSASDGTCVSTAVTSVSVNPTPNLSAGNASMCINASQNMTVSGANNYTWMPGSLTGSSIVVNPAGTTIYTVTGENTFGCKTSVNATLTVLQLPVFSTTVLNTVCTPGNGTVLTSATLNYTANLPGTVNGSTLILTPTVTGVYTVTGSDGFCSSTSTIYFTVSSPPVLTVAPTGSACSNASYYLNASGAGAGSYTWMPGNLNNLTSVLVQSNTVFTVTGANPLGCQSTATQSVFVTPSPTMIPGALSYSVCPGESLTLTASGSTAFTTWNPGNINGQSIVITPALSGTTIYTVSGNNGLCWSTATTVVNVFPSPTISISGALSGSMCSGTSLTLTGNGADIYSWSPSGTNNSSINITAGNTSTLISLSGTINATGCKTTETLNINVSQSPTLTASANPTLVCAGQSSTLIASGALNYLWSPGAVANYSISVTPTNNTTYYVYGAIGSCTAMLPVSVAWSPVPILSASASPTNVCSGQSATLTMASTNGTAYIWNPGNINNQAITVIPQGNTIYTATTFDSNGCSSTKTVAINVAPNPTITYSTNPSVICEGRTTTLTAMGATNYTWSLSGTAGPSLLIVPGPIYTDMIIGEQGGCVSYLQFNLGALPPPLVNIAPVPMTACEGATLPLTAFGGITYTWQPGNLIGSPIVVTPTASTIYSVTGTGTNGCSSQKTISINTIPPPVISVEGIKDFFCEGETALLQGMGASSYTWMPLNLITASISVTPSSSSIYTLVGMKFGCVSQLQFTVTVEDCTGLKDAPESKDTRIFPNPFNSEFVINFGDAFSGNVALYNALGQLISEHQVYNRRELKIIVPEIAKGIYLLQITSYDTESVKIVKLLKD